MHMAKIGNQGQDPDNTAFEALKTKVISASVLIFSDDTRLFKVKADSSNYATGSVLSQLGEDGK